MESPTDFLKTPANGRDDTSARSTRDHNNRGALLHLDGDLAGARAEYEAALAIDPDNVTALNNLGFLLAQDSQNEAALGCLERAVALDPDRSTAHVNIGNVRAAMGDLESALDAYQAALQ